MRTVETVELASVVADSRVAARRGGGRTVNVAAALAVPRHLRGGMRGVFVRKGKFRGKRIRNFDLLKTSRGFIADFSSIAGAAWLRLRGKLTGERSELLGRRQDQG